MATIGKKLSELGIESGNGKRLSSLRNKYEVKNIRIELNKLKQEKEPTPSITKSAQIQISSQPERELYTVNKIQFPLSKNQKTDSRLSLPLETKPVNTISNQNGHSNTNTHLLSSNKGNFSHPNMTGKGNTVSTKISHTRNYGGIISGRVTQIGICSNSNKSNLNPSHDPSHKNDPAITPDLRHPNIRHNSNVRGGGHLRQRPLNMNNNPKDPKNLTHHVTATSNIVQPTNKNKYPSIRNNQFETFIHEAYGNSSANNNINKHSRENANSTKPSSYSRTPTANATKQKKLNKTMERIGNTLDYQKFINERRRHIDGLLRKTTYQTGIFKTMIPDNMTTVSARNTTTNWKVSTKPEHFEEKPRAETKNEKSEEKGEGEIKRAYDDKLIKSKCPTPLLIKQDKEKEKITDLKKATKTLNVDTKVYTKDTLCFEKKDKDLPPKIPTLLQTHKIISQNNVKAIQSPQNPIKGIRFHEEELSPKNMHSLKANTSFNELKNTNINDYQIGRKIGQGAYAVVKEATHKKTGKKVAIKIYDKYKLLDPQRKKSVNREIRILQRLNHPHIVKLYEVIDTAKQIYLVMEIVKGRSLYSYLKSKYYRRMSESEARRMYKQIVSGINYLHLKNIVHRDIKLENLLLDERNDIKIIDFGFATITGGVAKKLSIFCGTPSYMAPEIVNKQQYLGPNADMWALGVLLFVMLIGSYPFKGATDRELYRRINRGFPTFPDYVPKRAKTLISKMLNLDPNKRPTSQDIFKDLFLRDGTEQEKEKEREVLAIRSFDNRIDDKENSQSLLLKELYKKYDKTIIDKLVKLRYHVTKIHKDIEIESSDVHKLYEKLKNEEKSMRRIERIEDIKYLGTKN